MKVIEVKNLHRSFRSTKKREGFKGALGLLIRPEYQTHEALKGVSFDLSSGEFIGLIGANGAGKTTLLKILSGLIPATAGTTRVLGFDPFKRTLEFRRKISLVMGQKAQLWWDLPALDAFDLIRAIYEIPRQVYRKRLNHLAGLLDVERHLSTQIRRLSLGERMKMELIGAILHWPSVIFLDEPTIGLDVLAAHKLREFLRDFNREEKATIILTSHNMEDIERLCPRVLILRSGELIYDGPPGRLTREGEIRLRVRLMQSPSLDELARITEIPKPSIEMSSDSETPKGESRVIYFAIKREQSISILQLLMNHFEMIDMGIEEQSLEKVIQHLYEGNALGF